MVTTAGVQRPKSRRFQILILRRVITLLILYPDRDRGSAASIQNAIRPANADVAYALLRDG